MRFSLNNLSFGGKFVLVLMAATIGLPIFASLGISSKISEYDVARTTEKAMRLIEGVDEVIVALQRERGLSMAFARDPESPFGQELKHRRTQTDSSISDLVHILGRSGKRQSPPFLARDLTALRKKVDTRGEHHSVFAGYTEMIESGLRLIHVMLGPMNTDGTNSYMPLHWSQEAAGRQRAALMGMLADQEFSVSEYHQLAAHTQLFAQKLDEFEHAANTAELAKLHAFKSHPASIGVKRYLDIVANKLNLLTHARHIQLEAGFLGLIHDYKNFQIRGDARFYDGFIEKYSRLQSHIEDLAPYANTKIKKSRHY